MTAPSLTPLSHRDRAVLRAVAAGRAEISPTTGGTLVIDGRYLSDQFAGPRLTAAGLIDPHNGSARLTPVGAALLAAA